MAPPPTRMTSSEFSADCSAARLWPTTSVPPSGVARTATRVASSFKLTVANTIACSCDTAPGHVTLVRSTCWGFART